MEPECSWQCSQESPIGNYRESNQHPPTIFSEILLILSFYLRLGLKFSTFFRYGATFILSYLLGGFKIIKKDKLLKLHGNLLNVLLSYAVILKKFT
jgi:hypothetical protein